MTLTRKVLLDQLLSARRELQAADNEALQARLRYEAAEEAYLNEHPLPSTPPSNVIVGSTVIMVKDEWYDLKVGNRLEYHTVERCDG